MKTASLQSFAPLVLLALAPLAFGQTPSLATKRAITVEGALVTMIDDVNVPATEIGMLTALHVREGQLVDSETLLADIDNRETIAKQLIGQGELEAAQAQAASTAEIEVAEKAIQVAQAELDSMRDIRKTNPGAVSETELRKYQFQLERAQAQLKLAVTEQNIARLNVKTKASQLQAISIELDRRQLKAPFRGEVVEIYKKRGEWTQAGEPVLHLVRMDKVRIKGFVNFSEGVSPDQLEGRPVKIVVFSAGDKQHKTTGKINFASRVIEGVSNYRQFRVSVDVENEKLVDPATGKESWAIQPGTMANLAIDLSPAAPLARPAVTPIKTTPVGGRVEVRKPTTTER
ncbi:MAG TPA: HlyD family efflux transporter periplasmic adaptor subunit [Pirellulaceae bacterium]|nr:HlyD family efflux transporter periplasmic adaptor subunit [Pirellulaceae bacterium]